MENTTDPKESYQVDSIKTSAGKTRTPGGGKEYYETCPDFFSLCHAEFGFNIDLAASEYNAKCILYFDKQSDALSLDWTTYNGPFWLNPPYSRGMVPRFLQKCWETSQENATLVCLVHTCTDTAYWRDWVWDKAAEVRHVQGRLKFWLPYPDKKGRYGTTSDLPHSLIVYRPNYLGRTFQSNWDWKTDFIKRLGPLPVRDIYSQERKIKAYIHLDGSRVAA